ncbi:hypothetical protein I302_100466 [Kwoniella bestiolae CBS 10118]|uniref:Uncharacterized protein n=1 Tax=Kwoniella bestiolae CBS 10118 TaxID=1296100 RepID=A0A1B9G572_9TREE|nr:hypothetical protein I302_03839 [Kwoniella bestiolae CBS 10118]OCF26161.1 hypothetical protein I302_03839 [Kwoniella bestiolae CBS 10118]
MWDKLVGSTLLYENTTGKIAIGRRRFKDRLLRHTQTITLHSHGDDDDQDTDEEEEQEDYFGNLKKLSILSHTHSRNSSSSSIFSFGKRSTPSTPIIITPPAPQPIIPPSCPPVPLNGVMPRLSTLRIILADAYDYHLLFCPRFGSACPLLEGLELDKLIIIGARSPLVVLPTAFPATTIETNSPMGLTPNTSRRNTPTTTSPALPTPPLGAPTNTTKIKSSGGLPIGLSELTVILPTGRSYDSKDYEGYHNIFHYKKTLESISKLTIVFLTSINHAQSQQTKSDRTNGYDRGQDRSLWQVAFYSSRTYNPTWTSYLCLAEDLAKACLAVPLETQIEIVGIENIDGELLNMGINTLKERGKSGRIMQERIQRQIEVGLIASNRECNVGVKGRGLVFRELGEWLEKDGRRELGEEGLKELGKEGYREFK